MFKYFKICTQTSILKSCNLVAIAFNEERNNIKSTSPKKKFQLPIKHKKSTFFPALGLLHV